MLVSAHSYVPSFRCSADADTADGGRHNQVGGPTAGKACILSFLRLFAGIAICSGWSCGNVTFVDAPYAPRKIAILYSGDEDVTVIRWRMGAETIDSDIWFDLLDQDGSWRPIDFSKSVFKGGVGKCGDQAGKNVGLCAQFVLDGRYEPPRAPTPLRTHNPAYGVSPGDTPALTVYEQTLSLKPAFTRGNGTIEATITDVIGGDSVFRFERPLEKAVWQRRAVCVPGFHPADAQFQAIDDRQQPWPAPSTLSADGRYCAAVRGVKTTGDPGVDEPVAVDTVPDVTSGDHLYTVPTEITPFSYQIVLDLSIPVADLCQTAIQQIQSTVGDALRTSSPTRALPALDLSTQPDPFTGAPGSPCHQSGFRSIDAAAVAQKIKIEAARWTEQHPRFFLLYFNNLRAALPDTMVQSLYNFSATIVSPPPAVDFVSAMWAFGPSEMSASYGGWNEVRPWLSASDPEFGAGLRDWAKGALPLISEIQDSTKPILILSKDDAQKMDGAQIRLCEASVTPVQDAGLQPIQHDSAGNLIFISPYARQWQVRQTDPPAYLLNLPVVWAVPQVGFMPHQSHIRYEICTRYCDHAFTSQSGVRITTGWLDSSSCMGPAAGAKT
jgi:hypothetical protein